MFSSPCIAPRHPLRMVAKRLLEVGVSGVEPVLRGPTQGGSPRTRSASPRANWQPSFASPRPRQVALPLNSVHATAIGALQLRRASAVDNLCWVIAASKRRSPPGAEDDQVPLVEIVVQGAAALPALPSAFFGAVRKLQGAATLPALLTAIFGVVRWLQGVATLPALRIAFFGVASPSSLSAEVVLLVALTGEVHPVRPPAPDGYLLISSFMTAGRGKAATRFNPRPLGGCRVASPAHPICIAPTRPVIAARGRSRTARRCGEGRGPVHNMGGWARVATKDPTSHVGNQGGDRAIHDLTASTKDNRND